MSSASSRPPQIVEQEVAEHKPQHAHSSIDTNSKPVAPSDKVPWGSWRGVLYAVLVFFASQFLVAYVLYFIAGSTGKSTAAAEDWLGTVPLQFVFVLCAEVLTFAAILWFVRRQGGTLRQIGIDRPKWRYVGWSLGGFALYFVIYLLLYAVVSRHTGIDTNQSQDLGFSSVIGPTQLLLTFLSLVVLPPIVEEVVFRGFIFSGMRGRMRFIWSALFTSVLFAVAHLQFGNGEPLLWIAAIDTFTLSMVMCWVRDKTGSILPTIGIHAIKNGLAFFVLYVITT